MGDVFKIGVTISLNDQISAGLRAIGAELSALDAKVKSPPSVVVVVSVVSWTCRSLYRRSCCCSGSQRTQGRHCASLRPLRKKPSSADRCAVRCFVGWGRRWH